MVNSYREYEKKQRGGVRPVTPAVLTIVVCICSVPDNITSVARVGRTCHITNLYTFYFSGTASY